MPWGSKTSIVSSVAVGVCALSIALLLVWMLRNRDLQLVRLMQPSFCFGFLSAAFISLLCIATLNVRHSCTPASAVVAESAWP